VQNICRKIPDFGPSGEWGIGVKAMLFQQGQVPEPERGAGVEHLVNLVR
jgi:hypothetical protein